MIVKNIKSYTPLGDEIATWKIFIEIMEDEYFTLKSELNRIIGKKRLSEEVLKVLESLQTNILESEKRLGKYKKSLLEHFERLNTEEAFITDLSTEIWKNHQLLLDDEEHVKQNLVDLKKSFSEFIHLMNDKKLV